MAGRPKKAALPAGKYYNMFNHGAPIEIAGKPAPKRHAEDPSSLGVQGKEGDNSKHSSVPVLAELQEKIRNKDSTKHDRTKAGKEARASTASHAADNAEGDEDCEFCFGLLVYLEHI